MILAQEIQNASTSGNVNVAIALGAFAIVFQIVREVLTFLSKRSEGASGGPNPAENARAIRELRADIGVLASSSRESRDIIIATKTIVDSWGQQF